MKTRWKIWTQTEEAWGELLHACEESKKTIDFEEYSFGSTEEGEIGKQFCEVLRTKALEGVRVRLLLDAVASIKFMTSELSEDLKKVGVQIHFYTYAKQRWKKFLNRIVRDHRKIAIIDRRVAYTGGIIVDEKARDWRDNWVRFEGPIATAILREFDIVWDSLTKHEIFSVESPVETEDGFGTVASGPQSRDRHILRMYLEKIENAQKEILITSPYFNPPRVLTETIRKATSRGVGCSILLAERADIKFVDFVSHSFVEEYLRFGARIFFYDGYIHAKAMMVDSSWATIGSTNFDRLSFLYDHEFNVTSRNKLFVEDIKNLFIADSKVGREIKPSEWKNRPFSRKLLEKLYYPLRLVV